MRKISLLLALGVLALQAWGVNVTTTSGCLSSVVVDHSITSLTVSGTLDARDFRFIADSLRSVTELDLSAVDIEAYDDVDNPVFGTATSYPAQTIPNTAFFGMDLKTVVLPHQLRTVGFAAFAGCGQLVSVDFPATVDSIGSYAYSGCNSLTAVSLPSTVRAMGQGTFSRCSSLSQASIDCQTIGADAFKGCTRLASVTIGKNVTLIGAGAFAGCTTLVVPEIASPSSVTGIGEEAFVSSGVEQFNFKACEQLKTVGQWAFASTPLASVDLPDGIEAVGDGAFFYDTQLKQLRFPSSVVSIGNYVLAGSNAVAADSVFSRGLVKIGSYALYNWNRVARLIIPRTVESIGTKAMAGMTALKELIAEPMTVPESADSLWAGVDQSTVTLYVNTAAVGDYKAAPQWKEFKIIDDPTLDVDQVKVAAVSVKAHFSGATLVIEASAPMARVSIVTPEGILLSSIANAGERAEIDTQNYAGRYYLVQIVLDGGVKKTLKLLR